MFICPVSTPNGLLIIIVNRNYVDKKQHMISQGNTINGISMRNIAALQFANFTVTPLQVHLSN